MYKPANTPFFHASMDVSNNKVIFLIGERGKEVVRIEMPTPVFSKVLNMYRERPNEGYNKFTLTDIEKLKIKNDRVYWRLCNYNKGTYLIKYENTHFPRGIYHIEDTARLKQFIANYF